MIAYIDWWKEIALTCQSFTVIDQGLARCNHEGNHWGNCNYETCPQKGER